MRWNAAILQDSAPPARQNAPISDGNSCTTTRSTDERCHARSYRLNRYTECVCEEHGADHDGHGANRGPQRPCKSGQECERWHGRQHADDRRAAEPELQTNARADRAPSRQIVQPCPHAIGHQHVEHLVRKRQRPAEKPDRDDCPQRAGTERDDRPRAERRCRDSRRSRSTTSFSSMPIRSCRRWRSIPRPGARSHQSLADAAVRLSWLRWITNHYLDFSPVTDDALVYATNALRLELTAARKARLLYAYLHLARGRCQVRARPLRPRGFASSRSRISLR